MVDFLVENPFVLLFLVLGLGYLLGKVRVAGFGLGVSAVLFVGLAFGALSPRITLPEFVYQFGLILFVYTVGVSAGPGFVAALRRRGWASNLAVVSVLVATAVTVGLGARWAHLSKPLAAGVFTGAATNTPALAGVLQHQADANAGARALTEPVLGYSVAYPFGVLGMILAVWAARRLWRPAPGTPAGEDLVNLTVRVTSPDVPGKTVGEDESGRGESDPRFELGKLAFYH